MLLSWKYGARKKKGHNTYSMKYCVDPNDSLILENSFFESRKTLLDFGHNNGTFKSKFKAIKKFKNMSLRDIIEYKFFNSAFFNSMFSNGNLYYDTEDAYKLKWGEAIHHIKHAIRLHPLEVRRIPRLDKLGNQRYNKKGEKMRDIVNYFISFQLYFAKDGILNWNSFIEFYSIDLKELKALLKNGVMKIDRLEFNLKKLTSIEAARYILENSNNLLHNKETKKWAIKLNS